MSYIVKLKIIQKRLSNDTENAERICVPLHPQSLEFRDNLRALDRYIISASSNFSLVSHLYLIVLTACIYMEKAAQNLQWLIK